MGAIGTFINVGKVDGSEAMPGTVGEFQSNYFLTTISTRYNENAWDGVPFDNIAGLNLTPGDWDVGVHINMEPDQNGPGIGTVTYICAYLLTNVGVIQWYYLRGVTAWDLTLNFSAQRINSPVPINMQLLLEIVTTGATFLGPVNVWGHISARRMR